MPIEIEVGLYPLADNPNLTFIAFMAVTLLLALGVRFGVYAHLNHRRVGIADQVPIWRWLTYAGVLSALYGLLWLVEMLTSLTTPFRGGVILAVTLSLAVAIRRIHVSAGGSTPTRLEYLGLAAGLLLVMIVVVGGLGWGPGDDLAALEGVAALLFVGYGFAHYREQTARSRLQGTMIDSLLRHLLPVLAFAALVSVVNVARPFGLERIVVLHVQVVFVIMTATALMTATIKLRQNLASL